MPEPITRLNTALEGRYRIESEVGEGGMAKVFLAKDLKHNRNVALKVLKPELAAVVGAERFLAEIETTANLQHPHILPLFDSGEADGFLFYVMPFVEGETLRERVDREKQLPVHDAVTLASKVAGALQHAHEHGVIHRDIKPANILLQGGEPVVADFGIALAVGAGGGARLTETGLSVGTPYYMSPEQATGDQVVGPASDTYSLAAVLYEILTGDPPYVGSTAQAVLGKIIQGAPVSATAIRKSIPENVDAAIRKALEKLPADRFTGAQEFSKALADPGFRHGDGPDLVGGATPGPWNRVAVTFAALFGVTALALGWSLRSSEVPALVERFPLDLDASERAVILPDGSSILFARPTSGGDREFWLHDLGSLTPTPIPGTEGQPTAVTASPSGDEIAIVHGEGDLTVVPLGAGVAQVVADDAWGGLTWGLDGFIYYGASYGGIHRVPAGGGPKEVVTRLGEGEYGHAYYRVVPGRDAAVLEVIAEDETRIEAVRISTGERSVLASGLRPNVTPEGHVVFASVEGGLFGAPFDADNMQLTRAPVPLLQGVAVLGGNLPIYSVSESGSLLYREAATQSNALTFSQISMGGVETPLDSAVHGPSDLGWEISPDGMRIAYQREVAGNRDIYVAELPSGPVTRLTFHEAIDQRPHWTADGGSVSFTSQRTGQGAVWSRRADGAGAAQLVFDGLDVNEGVWSPAGEWLVLKSAAEGSVRSQIFAIRPGIDSVATPLLVAEGVDYNGPSISRDGRWLAYASDETGRQELWVRPFPNVDAGQWQISSDRGAQSVWSHSGRELFYIVGGVNNQMIAVEFVTDPTFRVVGRRPLFDVPLGYQIVGEGGGGNQDVMLDDQGFILAGNIGREVGRLILVTKWFDEVRTLMGN